MQQFQHLAKNYKVHRKTRKRKNQNHNCLKRRGNLQNQTQLSKMVEKSDNKFEITVIDMFKVLMGEIGKNAKSDNFSRDGNEEIMKTN